MADPMGPDEAAERILGWKGKRRGVKLMRWIRSKERACGHEIAIRTAGVGRGARYGITEPMLRLHLPELFAPQIDSLAQELSKKIDQLKATIGATVDERMAPQVQKLQADHQYLTAQVTRLTTSTDDGFTRIESRLRKLEDSNDEKSSRELPRKSL